MATASRRANGQVPAGAAARVGRICERGGNGRSAVAAGAYLQHYARYRRPQSLGCETQVRPAASLREDFEGGLPIAAHVHDKLFFAGLSVLGQANPRTRRSRHSRPDDSGRNRLPRRPCGGSVSRITLLRAGRRANAQSPTDGRSHFARSEARRKLDAESSLARSTCHVRRGVYIGP